MKGETKEREKGKEEGEEEKVKRNRERGRREEKTGKGIRDGEERGGGSPGLTQGVQREQ